ncbi:uncharacterized protein TNCT_660991 [Trichonephila clavata]|uniref:Uncharacterized protein n=1 Tax=Trichonephila clavata TaxID=2740835 RepID=A0A8X6HGD0_TRICU|nr:uncharacterized protein TNCT_660991 [Trichonephila clavata]
MKSDTSPLVFCTLLYRMRGPMNRLLIGQDTVADKRISTLEEDGYLWYSDVSIMGVTGYTHYASSPHLLSQTVSQYTCCDLSLLITGKS